MFVSRLKILLGFTLLLTTLSVFGDSLSITDAWVKNLPPVTPVRAGYMTINNNTNQAVTIISTESEVFNAVDIHETVMKDGMMSMQALPHLTINPGETTRLAPGGMHLMMMKPRTTLKPGDIVSVTLNFDDGNSQTLKMTVRK